MWTLHGPRPRPESSAQLLPSSSLSHSNSMRAPILTNLRCHYTSKGTPGIAICTPRTARQAAPWNRGEHHTRTIDWNMHDTNGLFPRLWPLCLAVAGLVPRLLFLAFPKNVPLTSQGGRGEGVRGRGGGGFRHPQILGPCALSNHSPRDPQRIHKTIVWDTHGAHKLILWDTRGTQQKNLGIRRSANTDPDMQYTGTSTPPPPRPKKNISRRPRGSKKWPGGRKNFGGGGISATI